MYIYIYTYVQRYLVQYSVQCKCRIATGFRTILLTSDLRSEKADLCYAARKVEICLRSLHTSCQDAEAAYMGYDVHYGLVSCWGNNISVDRVVANSIHYGSHGVEGDIVLLSRVSAALHHVIN